MCRMSGMSVLGKRVYAPDIGEYSMMAPHAMLKPSPYSSYRPRSSGYVAPRYKRYYRRQYGRSVAARVRKSLSIEKKFFDTAVAFTVDATAEVPTSGQWVLIPQGVTESTRVGRQCTIKSVQFRANLTYIPGADTLGCTTAYVYLVLDKQANGAAAAVTDVFTGTSMQTAMLNLSNSERFRILKKWVLKFQAGAGVSGAYGRDSQSIEYFKKCNIPVEYSSTTGAITELKSNNLFIIAGTDATADDEVNVSGTARLRFTDL